MKSRAPGPGAYNSLSSFKTVDRVRNGFGNSTKISDQVYFKELQKSYVSKHAPGPGAYNSRSFFAETKPGGKINPPSKTDNQRIPTTTRGKKIILKRHMMLEDHQQFLALKRKQGQVKIGTAPRIYDPVFYSAQNKEFIIKGLQ